MWKFFPALLFLLAISVPAHGSEREYKKVLATMSRWEKQYPKLITRHSIGKSHQGRDLTVLRLSYSNDENLPGIYLGSSIHGIEYSHQDLTVGIDGLLKYCSTKQGQTLLSTRIVWVQLMMNPDGVRNTTRKNARGVDLNRNFGYRWGENWKNKRELRSRSFRYPGVKAFSEPESKAVRDFLQSHRSISVYFDFHRSAHIIFAPFGAEKSALPKPFMAFFTGLNKAMGNYNRGRDPRIIKSVSSGSGYTIDWVYAKLGIYALTLEFPARSSRKEKESLVAGVVYLVKNTKPRAATVKKQKKRLY